MERIAQALLAMLVIFLISKVLKAFVWVWLAPKKAESHLSKQGLKGSPYKFLVGDVRELSTCTKQAKAKPMEFSHKIGPRVLPFYHNMIQKHGKMCMFWFGTIPKVIVTDPDLIKEILFDKSRYFEKPRSNPVGRLLVSGVVRLEGEKWAKHRKIINPAFNLDKLKMMLPAFFTSCCELITKWQKLVGKDSYELDVYPDLKSLTADVISRTAFGSSYEDGRRIFQLQTEQSMLVMQAAQYIMIPGFLSFPTKNNNRMKEIQREVAAILRDMITNREKAMENGQVESSDLLGLLMETNMKEMRDHHGTKSVGITVDEIIEECKLFYFAGQDTTMNLLVWTMIVLSKHQDWQEIARKEVFQVFGTNKPDFDGLNHLKIVTMILNEVLRLYPPIAYLLRAISKTIKLGDVTLHPGTEIVIPSLLIQHDHEIWGEDADEFNPERFSGGVSKATKNKVSFLPFGWGPRICMGQTFAFIEARMAVAMILQNFSFKLSPTYVHTPHTVISLQPQLGAPLILHKL